MTTLPSQIENGAVNGVTIKATSRVANNLESISVASWVRSRHQQEQRQYGTDARIRGNSRFLWPIPGLKLEKSTSRGRTLLSYAADVADNFIFALRPVRSRCR